MEIKVGEYVRTKDGVIAKLDYVEEEFYYFDNYLYREYEDEIDFLTVEQLPEYITKHSPKIIDLIEVGDYVNGKEIHEIDEQRKRLYSYERDDYHIFNERDIQRIVTHEQMEEMEYKVNDK